MELKLLNGQTLAKKLGKSPWWVVQAKKAGMPFACGLITFEDAWSWMKENPDFRAEDFVKEPVRTVKDRRKSAFGKLGESFRKHGPRSASLGTSALRREQAA